LNLFFQYSSSTISVDYHPIMSDFKKEVRDIVNNKTTQELLAAHGLKAMEVTWEDTGRSKGSCVGPNISDLTLVDGNDELYPVIRNPNYSDVTSDVPIEKFTVKVGNEKGEELKTISLKEYLENWQTYCLDQKDVEKVSLLLERDKQVLVNSQCCVLPVKKGQELDFGVQLFNYQSYNGESAVLVIMATSNGTSACVVSGTTKLYFNNNQISHLLNLSRLEDVRIKRGDAVTKIHKYTEMKVEEADDNKILVIQVPLKVQRQTRGYYGGGLAYVLEQSCMMTMPPSDSCSSKKSNNTCYSEDEEEEEECCEEEEEESLAPTLSSNTMLNEMSHDCPPKKEEPKDGMDFGQIDKSVETFGSYKGAGGKNHERDDRFPIRITVQCYRAHDSNVMTGESVADIKKQLDAYREYEVATGSLVLETTNRVTEPTL
jgi:hypothetical protein